MTVRLKITLLITAAGLLSSLVFSIITLWEMMEQPFDLIDAELKTMVRRAVQHPGLANAPAQPNMPSFLDQERDWLEISAQDSGAKLYRSSLAQLISIPDPPSGTKAVIRRITVPGQLDFDQDERGQVAFRVLRSKAEVHGKNVVVTVARPIEELEEELWDTVEDVVSALALSMLMLLAASYVAAAFILRPIKVLNDQARDISERHLERRLPVAANARDEFNTLAKTLNLVFDRLQHAFLRQKRLIADASHELKTPLTMMRLALEHNQDPDETMAAKCEQIQQQNLERLSEQVLRMERLVKNLLDLSSLESEARVKQEPLDLAAMLQSLLADYHVLAEPRGIRLQADLPPHLGMQGDADKLYRAFSNLLDNAIKYNVDGGEVRMTARQTPAGMIITMSNTGPAIPAAEQDKVFEQFYRVDKSRSVKYGGSGLGLAIVKRIIELHGGTVRLESAEDCTRVHISIPVAWDG